MPVCQVAFGGNLGDVPATYSAVQHELRALAGVMAVRASRLYRSAPVGGPAGQPPYLNAVLGIHTTAPVQQLFAQLMKVEARLGRQRHEPWGARTIDLDLLLAEDYVLADPALLIPHPRLHWRRFVLEPLTELAGAAYHPLLRCSLNALLASMNQQSARFVVLGDPDSCRDAAAQIRGHDDDAEIITISARAGMPVRSAWITWHGIAMGLDSITMPESPTGTALWSNAEPLPWVVLLDTSSMESGSNPGQRHAGPIVGSHHRGFWPVIDCRPNAMADSSTWVRWMLEARQPLTVCNAATTGSN